MVINLNEELRLLTETNSVQFIYQVKATAAK